MCYNSNRAMRGTKKQKNTHLCYDALLGATIRGCDGKRKVVEKTKGGHTLCQLSQSNNYSRQAFILDTTQEDGTLRWQSTSSQKETVHSE